MRSFLFFILFLRTISVFSQTGIGTTTPNPSAKLDVYSTNKGFLPPRVTLSSAIDATTIASPAEGLLVYNLGSVGLQAGYYYWNGANWATIATANSAGNGVTAMDMVQLYSRAWSGSVGNIEDVNGYSFTVPVSGRYLFDFSSTSYNSGYTTFKVRQNSTVLALDSQYSINNTVHVEYNGKVEVNLQSNTTYNLYVKASGSRDAGDWNRVYYKMVAGNLPVTGQTVDYLQASLSSNQTLSAIGNIIFNTSSGTGITLSSGGFNLIANKTYKLEAAVGGSSGGYAYYAWVDNANNILPGGSTGAVIKSGNTYTDGPQDKAIVYYTPTVNTTVYLRVYGISGTLIAYAPSLTSNYSSTWASIQQIGSSAIINPWILSGTNTYNTTGNVGIGNNAPTSTLDVTGSLAVSGATNLKGNVNVGTGVGSEGGEIDLATAASGSTTLSGSTVAIDVYGNNLRIFENGGSARGVYIDLSSAATSVGTLLNNRVSSVNLALNTTLSLENLTVQIKNQVSGPWLFVGTVSGTANYAYSISYQLGNGANTNNQGTTGTISASTTMSTVGSNTWYFVNPGSSLVAIITDTTNNKMYRITYMMTNASSPYGNFVTIERII